MCLQINTVKYDANREIKNIYENLQIVWSQFCTDLQLLIYIWSSLNIYLFIGTRICCQWIQTNSYLVTFGYSQHLVQHLMNDPEGRKITIRHYLVTMLPARVGSQPYKQKACQRQMVWLILLQHPSQEKKVYNNDTTILVATDLIRWDRKSFPWTKRFSLLSLIISGEEKRLIIVISWLFWLLQTTLDQVGKACHGQMF